VTFTDSVMVYRIDLDAALNRDRHLRFKNSTVRRPGNDGVNGD